MDPQLASSNSKGTSVRNRSDAATNTRVDYENFMFLLVLTRLLEDSRVKRFHIAQNVEGVGVFDDLVVVITYKPKGQDTSVTKLFMVQLKHMNSRSVTLASLTAPSGSGHFNLNKYYNDFKTVMNNVGKFKDVVLSECPLKDMTFVVYTNARCPLGDNNYHAENSLCRELLETGVKSSNIFSFNSTQRFEKFHKELEKNNSPITRDVEGQEFLQQLVFFAGQSTTTDLQRNLMEKLGKYFVKEVISQEDILHRAVSFLAENNGMWMSRHSGGLSDITITFQGFKVKLNDACKFWGNREVTRKIIIKHICQEKGNLLEVGKVVRRPIDYYIARIIFEGTFCSLLIKQMEYNDYWRTRHFENMTMLWNESTLDTLVFLSDGPGMGKTVFLTYQAHLLKSENPGTYVIRENLLDHSSFLKHFEITEKGILMAEIFLAEMAGVTAGTLDHDVFKCCLYGNYRMAIFLDGMDEISPHYFDKVCAVIEAIHEEFQVHMVVSTRPLLRDKIKEYFKIELWHLNVFNYVNINSFLQNYVKIEDLSKAELDLAEIPIFCKMLRDIYKSGDGSVSNVMLTKVELYDKFVEGMYQLYCKENDKGNEKQKQLLMENYEMAAVLFFSMNQNIPRCITRTAIENYDAFISGVSQGIDNLGLIQYIFEGTATFVHLSFAEYFAGRWFARYPAIFKELFDDNDCFFTTEVDFFMSSKLNQIHPLFHSILNVTEKNAIEGILKKHVNDLDLLDPLGRDLLHYAKLSTNCNAQNYIFFHGGFTLTEDIIHRFRFTSLSLLVHVNVSCAWLSIMLKKYPRNSHLLGLLLFKSKFVGFFPYFIEQYSKNSPLHIAIREQNKEDILKLIESNLNSQNDLGLTPLHMAVAMNDVETVRLLGEHNAKYSRDNIFCVYPHQMVPNISMFKCNASSAAGCLQSTNCKGSPLHLEIVEEIKERIAKLLPRIEELERFVDVSALAFMSSTSFDEKMERVVDHIRLSGDVYYNSYCMYLLQKKQVPNMLRQFYDNFMIEDNLRAEIMGEDYVLQGLPLHNAAQKNKLEEYLKMNSHYVVRLIMSIKFRAESFRSDSKGRTVLHVAAANACTKMSEISQLIRLRIEYTMDDNGCFPHHYSNNVAMHYALLNYGFYSIFHPLAKEDKRIFNKKLGSVIPWAEWFEHRYTTNQNLRDVILRSGNWP